MAGEEPSPLQRTVALSDMGNGVSGVVGFDTHMFINPELSVHVWRLPGGRVDRAAEPLRPRRRAASGMAESSLYDRDGRFGRAVQSLFVDTR